MKAAILLALRASTGALLIIWGFIKIGESERAIGVSEKFYQSALSSEALQTPLGAAEIILGALVALGLFRRFVYPIQAIVLGLGALAIWRYLLDPLGVWLLTPETRQYLFFPSTTVFFASLALMAFKSEDRFSIDNWRK